MPKNLTEKDIKAAFSAGRRSIMSTIPRLQWKQSAADQYTAETPLKKYTILKKN